MNKEILILCSRSWDQAIVDTLSKDLNRPLRSVTHPSELTLEYLTSLDPQWIFVTHWSHRIPDYVWLKWPTIIFHMTELPYGRGGSPLQQKTHFICRYHHIMIRFIKHKTVCNAYVVCCTSRAHY